MVQSTTRISLSNTVVRSHQDLVISALDGETIMMSIQKGKFYGLDVVSGRIWELLQVPLSVSALVDHLMDEFNGERVDMEKDTLAFLDTLAAEGMLTIEAAPNR